MQDVPPVLEHAQLLKGIEKQPLNFFEGQPIKGKLRQVLQKMSHNANTVLLIGAKFYYLRNILHDYPDEQAIAILKGIIAALGPESEILIDEIIIPEKGTPLLPAEIDVLMSFSLGSRERTAEEWTKLLDAAGLKIKATHRYTR